MNWTAYSIMTLFSLGFMILCFKQLTLMKIDSVIINMYVFGLTFIGFLVFALLRKADFSMPKAAIVIIVLASVLALVGNYYNIKGLADAPNPAYHLSIAFTRLLLVAIAAVFLFKSDFNWLNFAGVLVTMIGVVLVSV